VEGRGRRAQDHPASLLVGDASHSFFKGCVPATESYKRLCRLLEQAEPTAGGRCQPRHALQAAGRRALLRAAADANLWGACQSGQRLAIGHVLHPERRGDCRKGRGVRGWEAACWPSRPVDCSGGTGLAVEWPWQCQLSRTFAVQRSNLKLG